MFIIEQLSEWMRPYQYQIAMAWIATVLVVYGDDLNMLIKRNIKGMSFVARVGIFVLVAAVGYGFLTIAGTQALVFVFRELSLRLLAPVIILLYITVGILAERKHHI